MTSKPQFAAFFTQRGDALIESYRADGSIEELFVLEVPTEPIQHDDDDCPPNCECRRSPNE